METVGTFEAKTHLSAILDKVLLGQEFIITKRGKPIARLIPEITSNHEQIKQAVKRLKDMRKGVTLGKIDWKELRDEGRA